jgi:hypothetical protein
MGMSEFVAGTVAGFAIGVTLMLFFHIWDSMRQLEYWLSVQRRYWRIVDRLRDRIANRDDADWWKQN